MSDAPHDDSLNYTVVGNEIQGSYIPAGSGGGTNTLVSGSVLSATTGGIKINLILDAAAQAAPQSFKDGLQQAAAILAASITDQITVNINIDYSGVGGGAAAKPDHGYLESYSWVRSQLINGAGQGDNTFNSLPNATTFQGESQVAVWNAQLKLWGVLGANDTTTDDASAYFTTDINPNLLVGVALHELTHSWGRVPYGPPYGTEPDVFDFYRFTSPGVRLISGASTAAAAYFSLDGGYTKIADYGQGSDPSDFLNSGVQGPDDPFNEYYTGTTGQGLTAIDLQQLHALGFHLAGPTTAVAALITANNPEMIATGMAGVITSSLLNATDASSSASQIVYSITSGPTHGLLLLNGTQTSSFTQADINSGNVTYHEITLGVISDGFSFTVTDAGGATTTVNNFQVNIDTSNTSIAHAAGKFNVDATSDIAWYNDKGSVSLWDSGQITSAHWVANTGTVAATSHIAGVGDFDGNGKSDILWHDDGGAAFIWDNGLPAGAHTIATAGSVPATLHIAGVGDFDANGKSDILWHDDNGAVFIWDNGQASGGHTVAAAGAVPTSWHIVGVGDFDGNAKSDILWQNDSGAMSIWDNGQISAAHWIVNPGVVPNSWHIAGIGDFDGNGKSDILWQNDNGALSIWDNGQISAAHWIVNPGVVPNSWHIAGLGDFDGNGKSDILWQNDNGAVSIWDNAQISAAHWVANPGVVPGTWHIA